MPTVRTGDSHSSSRTRRRGRRAVDSSLSAINVVPLVDVMLVMLVIFMVTAPMMQRGLSVNLPESRRAEPLAAEQLFVTVPLAYRTDGVVQVGDDRVQLDALAARLLTDLADRTEKSVFLRGDDEITYGELVQVFDVLKEGGVQEVGLVLAQPSGR